MNFSEKYLAVVGSENIGRFLFKGLRSFDVPLELLVMCDSDPVQANRLNY